MKKNKKIIRTKSFDSAAELQRLSEVAIGPYSSQTSQSIRNHVAVLGSTVSFPVLEVRFTPAGLTIDRRRICVLRPRNAVELDGWRGMGAVEFF